MKPVFQRDKFTWLAYLLLAFYSYYLNIFGPMAPFLKAELNLSYTVSSLHFTAFAVGMLVVGLEGHLVTAWLGQRRAFWVGAFGLSAGALLLISGNNPFITIGAAFLMGLIGSLILILVSSGLSEKHGELRAIAFAEANVMASVVSSAAPLLVGWLAQTSGGWRLALGLAASLPVFLWFGFGKVSLPTSANHANQAHQPGGALSLKFWVYWLALVLAVAIEFCMLSWSADYLENILGMLKAEAAQAVSLFLVAMIIGRAASSRLIQRFSAHQLVVSALLIASLGFLIFWTAGTALFGMIGLFITGLGVAGLYPLIISMAMGAAENNPVQGSARTALASGLAILALPLILGRLADTLGIWKAYGVVVFLLVGAFTVVQLAESQALERRSKPA